MKMAAHGLGLALALSGGVAFAAGDTAPIVARAEACLRANVDRIVAVEPNIQSASSFLLSHACAVETSGAAKYERNRAWLVAMTAFMKGANQMAPQAPFWTDLDASVDPETADFIIPPPKPDAKPSPMASMLPQMSMQGSMVFPETPSPSLRKLAGDLVMAARERQLSAKRR